MRDYRSILNRTLISSVKESVNYQLLSSKKETLMSMVLLHAGNKGSLDKCRRHWDLADSDALKYRFMNEFDRAMNHLDKAFGFSNSDHTWVSRKDEGDKLIVCERGDIVFVFNFHPTNSYTDYRIGCRSSGAYKVTIA